MFFNKFSVEAVETFSVLAGFDADHEKINESVYVVFSAEINAEDEDAVSEHYKILKVFDADKNLIASSREELADARDFEFADGLLDMIKFKMRAIVFAE